MDILSAVIAGIIQGFTEFLPVSSSGHLSLLHSFFGVASPDLYPALDVLLHLGTLAAVVAVYHKDVLQLITGLIRLFCRLTTGGFRFNLCEKNEKTALLTVTATVPVVIAALAGAGTVAETLGRYPVFVGAALVINGAVLFASEKYGGGKKTEDSANVSDAAAVGLFQAAAIVPGLSRSGMTAAGGLICGFEREYAVKFSFLLSIPAILGANLLKLPDIASGASGSFAVYAAGFGAAAVSGFASVKLLEYVSKKAKLRYFSYYCAAAGVASIICGVLMN